MFDLSALFRFVAVTLIMALAAIVVPAQANAQTIVNTAQASWTQSGQPGQSFSNTVSFQVAPPAGSVSIEPLRAAPGAAEYPQLTAPRCGGQPLLLGTGTAGTGMNAFTRATAITVGETLYFRISAPQANADRGVIDRLDLTLTSSSGDRELITVFETGSDTGIFVGGIPTRAVPPAAVSGDCRLSIRSGETITAEYVGIGGSTSVRVNVLADPYGLVFDSDDGTPVNGATVTLVDAATGSPATVFADDGVTRWPSTVISGQPVTDAAGNVHQFAVGEYRFPLAALGSYRLVISPPAPYSAPSVATPDQLARLTRPDGGALQIVPASYGQNLLLSSPAAIRVDIPVDRPSSGPIVTKTASRAIAVPGESVIYTVNVTNPDASRPSRNVIVRDTPAASLRILPGSVHVNGQAAGANATFTNDGGLMSVLIGDIPAGGTATLTYATTVRANAVPGQAENRVETIDSRGNRSVASASIRIQRDVIAGRVTLIGRVTEGGCAVDNQKRGIPGVRVMLEDGSFAITDADGRYHFEGLIPGTHVVQAATQTLPVGGQFTDCARSTRSAGSASSRFIFGQGGSLLVADFTAVLPQGATLPAGPAEAPIAADRAAAGAEMDWSAVGDGPTDFLFPTVDHNPRAPAVRVVIRHRKDEKVRLFADGKPVAPLSFDGTQNSPMGYAISVWRGIPLDRETTLLTAEVSAKDGAVITKLQRSVHFSAAPASFEVVAEHSRLIADGSSRPVVAVRILDRFGKPVHAGLTGGFTINAPYESAAQLDALQARQLSGLDRAAPTWIVKGDDGIAYLELAPTMVSGALRIEFAFSDGQVTRRQSLEGWIVPGDQKWTLIGLAEGTVGARSVADNMERAGAFDSDLGNNARVAFYAKGRVLGRYLLTVAYDSAKQKDDQPLLGAIDPNAYYTVFADGSDRRFDAASREKLYVRIEGKTFYALYGDFSTDFDKTVLARYVRNLTGLKGEGQFGALRIQGFAARSGALHRRDELQGAGISGPYRLSSRDIIPNSETVSIEVRDRFRSELIVDRKVLVRFVDYNIDMLSGTISFREPVLSRDTLLNPRFIVVEYDVDRATGGAINAGGRAEVTAARERVRFGATAITDTSSNTGERSDLFAVDLRARIAAGTELRAEAGVNRSAGANSTAWLVEIEHHDGRLDLLGYARSAASGFGLAQLSGAERGRRKVGFDGRYRFSDAFAVNVSAWHDQSLTDTARRDALEVSGTYRTAKSEFRLGVATFRDRLRDSSAASSTVLDAAVTQRFLDNRLEVTGAAQIALGGSDSIDLPSRYQAGVSYAVTSAIKLTAGYELADGKVIKARTARAGIEVSPWDGGRIMSSIGQQNIAEYGKRSFAAFGLSQSLPLTRELTVDATLDAARTIGGFDASRVINPGHPASSGGLIGESGSIAEDFTAVTLGATWRHDLWTATARGEYRDGKLANRAGATLGVIRQLKDGSAIGAGFTWTRATAATGAASEIFNGAISAAHRPADSKFAALYKLEYRSDQVSGAVAGEAGPAGRTALLVSGNALSRRLIGSISANWSPVAKADQKTVQRTEIGAYFAVRHNFDSYEDFDLAGTSLLGGADVRIGIGPRIEIGGQATVRYSPTDGTTNFAVGPMIGLVPADNVLLTVGYNVSGFRDRDFGASRNTTRGLFAAVRVKFDADLLGSLGLRQ